MLKIIIDFIFWNLLPVVIAGLAALSGAIFYFFSYDTNLLAQIKSFWRAVGIGLAVMFVAWIMVTIFMYFLGYRFGIYGYWWSVSF